MSPSDILLGARRKYNAVSDSFFSDDELLGHIYEACLEMAQECLVIERTYSTTSVASQQEYDYPGDTIAIKRMTYNGVKLDPIDMRDDDAITGLNQSTTSTGTPQFYYIWNDVIALRPIPSADGDTIKVWTYNEPAEVTTTSVLEIPTLFHKDIEKFVLKEMAYKDKQFEHGDRFDTKWETAKRKAKAWAKKKKRGDGFASVKSEEQMISGPLGLK